MIYLDHNATTPVSPDVFEAMCPFFRENWGNPSSSYQFGSKMKAVIETAREQCATLIGAYTPEVIFTSCGTESNNTAIHSALKSKPEKRHIVTSSVEHSSVLNYCMALEKEGYEVTYLPVNREGLLKISDLEAALKDSTVLVSLMWANNETGVLFPVEEIAQVCRARNVLFHCDAIQAAAKLEINLRRLPIDYLSLTGHKFYASKGIGILYVNRKTPFSPYLYGGHQERGRRGGTENVALIAGLGKAAEIAHLHLKDYDKKVRPLRDALENGLLDSIPGVELNGHKTARLANTTNITFRGVGSEPLLMLLDQEGVCASSGSACLADSDEPSHVVHAMKPQTNASREVIRFSLGLENKVEEINETLKIIREAVNTLREV